MQWPTAIPPRPEDQRFRAVVSVKTIAASTRSKRIGVTLAALAIAATACSTGDSATGGSAADKDMFGLTIDGNPTQLGRQGARNVSECGPQENGRLGIVWTGYSLDQSTDGTVSVVLNGDKTVYSVAIRLNTGTGETSWASYDYRPDEKATSAAASQNGQNANHYHITGTLQGGPPSPPGPQAPLQPALHTFDLKISCVTID